MPLGMWSRGIRMLGIAFWVAATASDVTIAREAATPAATETPPAIAATSESDAWELAPVLLYGREVPDSPGRKVLETGRLYAVDSATFVVWARVEETAKAWVLLGVRNARIETIGVEKSEEADRTGSKDRVLAIRRQEPGQGSRLGASVVAGQGLVYLQEKSFGDFPSGERNPIFCWDGRGLRKLLGPGDEISFRGVTYRCAGATLGNANASGTVLIAFTTSQPAKGFGLALHDAKGLRPILAEDQPVPGRPDARFRASTLSCGRTNVEEAVLADDGAVVLSVHMSDKAGTRRGIYAVTEDETRQLVAAGDPCPDEEGSKVRACDFKVVEARAGAQVVASFSCGRLKGRLWDGERWAVVDAGSLTVEQAVLLAPGSSWVFWKGSSVREEKRSGETVTLSAEGWGLFDGARSRDLRANGNNPTGFELVPGGGDFSGVVLQYGWGVLGLEDRFLDARAPGKGLQPVPRFKTLQGPSVPLSDVLTWTGGHSALVAIRRATGNDDRIGAGIYLMTMKQEAP